MTYNSQTFAYNPDDSIGSQTDAAGVKSTYSYDAAGRLTGDGTHAYCYDGFDRLTQVYATGTGCGASGALAAYNYDGLDRQNNQTESNTTTTLHYDGTSQLAAVESTSSGDTSYELTAQGSRKALNAPMAGQQYLTDDGHGNIATVTNPSVGTPASAVACTARFDPFGTPIAQGGQPSTSATTCNTGSTPNTFFYRGGRQDSVTGNYEFGSRTYDPSKNAFLTPDSYRLGDSSKNLSVGTDTLTEDRYNYVNGDPVNLADPNGHFAVCGDSEDMCYWTARQPKRSSESTDDSTILFTAATSIQGNSVPISQVLQNQWAGSNFEEDVLTYLKSQYADDNYAILQNKALRNINGQRVFINGKSFRPDFQIVDKFSGRIVAVYEAKTGTITYLSGPGMQKVFTYREAVKKMGYDAVGWDEPPVEYLYNIRETPPTIGTDDLMTKGLGRAVGILSYAEMAFGIFEWTQEWQDYQAKLDVLRRNDPDYYDQMQANMCASDPNCA